MTGLGHPSADPPREDGASRVSAYVYGNVLVMAALIALHPHDLRGPTGVLYLLGVGLSTYVAHVLGEAVGARATGGRSLDRAAVRHEVRNALPIATSAGAQGGRSGRNLEPRHTSTTPTCATTNLRRIINRNFQFAVNAG